MSIARTSHGATGQATSTGQTLSATVTAGDVLCAIVYTAGGDASSSLTWNGGAMTQVGTFTGGSSAATGTGYFLGSPATGTHNLISTVSSSDNIIYYVTYSGASTSVPTSFAGNENAGSSVSITLSTTGNAWFFAYARGQANSGVTNAVLLDNGNSGFNNSWDSNGIASSSTMTVSRTGSVIDLVGFAISEPAAATFAGGGQMLLRGV